MQTLDNFEPTAALNYSEHAAEIPSSDAVNDELSSRPTKPHIWLQDYVTRTKGTKCNLRISTHVEYTRLSPAYRQAILAYVAASEPTSFKEAASDPSG